jgi:hypothetical protein
MKILNLGNLFSKKSNKEKIKIENKTKTTAKQQEIVARSRRKYVHAFGGCMDSNPQAIFTPKRTGFKGWMRNPGQSLRERKNRN